MISEKKEIRETLFDVEHIRKQILQPYFSQMGLTTGQGQPRILFYLLRKENVTQKELADICRLDVTTLSRTLDRMEEAGLLARAKDPNSRRSYRICLTDTGRRKAEQVRAGFGFLDDCLWKGFEPEEMEEFYRCLKHIQKNLQQADPGALYQSLEQESLSEN
jgi:DNA-binding MarR family transcriptional regulator